MEKSKIEQHLEYSNLERQILESFIHLLNNYHSDIKYLSIPSLVKKETILNQEVISFERSIKINQDYALSGSAEQGILELFSGENISSSKYWALNQCFRGDRENGLRHKREFKKIELFAFDKTEKDSIDSFNYFISIVESFMKLWDVKYKQLEFHPSSIGYAKEKIDIEVFTKEHGWLETHSIARFGEEQSRRFNIRDTSGLKYMHTVSSTGIAVPRFLIPILEKENNK